MHSRPFAKVGACGFTRRPKRGPEALSVLLVVVCVCIAGGSKLQGEEPPVDEPGDAAAVHELEDIVVTGTRTEHEAADAPVPTQVIRREDILATSATNVADVLDEVPDIYVRRNTEFRMGSSTVRMQGADPNKVAILLNGRRFRGGVDGVVDVRDIPVEAIDRIEIIRGPASSLYGSDAMAGVINIITLEGTSQPTASVTAAGGNFDRTLISGHHGYSIGPINYFISAQHDEEQIARRFDEFSRQFAGAAIDAKQTRTDVFGTVSYTVAEEQVVTFTGDYNPVREGPMSDRQNVTLGLGWRGALDTLTTGDLDVNRYAFSRTNELPGFEEDVDYEDWRGEARLVRTLLQGIWAEQHLFTLGYRIRSEHLNSAGITHGVPGGPTFSVDGVDAGALQNSPYLQDEILFAENWSAVIGTSFDIHDNFGLEVNPRGTVTWRPWENYRVAATIGRGFRAPDLLQLYDVDANDIIITSNGDITGYVILGNPNLQAETDFAVNLECGAQPIPGLGATLILFRHDFQNLIGPSLVCFGPTMCVPGFTNPFPDLDGQVFRFENIARALTQGVDVSVRIDPLQLFGVGDGVNRVRLDLAYGYLYARNLDPRPGEGEELPFSPANRFLPALTYWHTGWGSEVKVWGEYEDEIFTDLTNSPDFVGDSHWLWNFRVSQALETLLPASALDLPGIGAVVDRMRVFAEGTNVFDEEFGLRTPMGRLVGRASFLFGVTVSTNGSGG